MATPGAPVLNLVPAVADLNLVITKGGGWSIALDVIDSTGATVDLTGTTAKILLPDATTWTATTSGGRYTFDIPKATVDAITFLGGTGTFYVTDGTHTTVWAKGKVTVQ